MGGVVYATSTRSVPMPGGYAVYVHGGSHWPADDPIVLAHPDLFSADPRYGMSYSSAEAQATSEARIDAPIEQATAAPGERRAVRIKGDGG